MALLRCTHCRHPLDMTDVEVYGRFTSLYGEDGPVATECDDCGQSFHVQEYVNRTWSVGVDADAAADLMAPYVDGIGA